ncbi:MAG: uridylate kinase [Hyphomicrobiaceae bacterium]|nr:uridylate kinase [Hyphomicrobiaceae bacterium]
MSPVVVKIGGSLISGKRLQGIVATIARARRPVVVVPGGGGFADEVRHVQAHHDVSDRAAHTMAILAMHQMGVMLQDMQVRFVAVETLAEIRQALAANRIPVWLPLRLSVADTKIPADWSVTSDGLAARLAERLRLQAVYLVKSRCVIDGPSAAELAADGIVDRTFADVVERARLSFRIFGPGEEADLARACLASPVAPHPSALRRTGGRAERARRGARRLAAGTGNMPSPRG